MEKDLERIWYGDLQPSSHLPGNSECESCGFADISRHMWADVDPNGVAEWCSVSEWVSIHRPEYLANALAQRLIAPQ